MFTKILLASDGSESALKAAEAAAELAERFGAALTVLHVFAVPLSIATFYNVPGVGMNPGSLSLLEAEAHGDVLRRTGEVLEKAGVAFATRQEEGNPAEVILRVAEEGTFDLVVLGSRGLSGIRSFLLGHISDRVTHHAHCPVLIVR